MREDHIEKEPASTLHLRALLAEATFEMLGMGLNG
jgi:hypothetical protein